MASNRIAVVTLQTLTGHGQRLQNYATIRICNELGFEAQNLVLEEGMVSDLVRRTKGVIKHLINPKGFRSDPQRVDAFREFNQKMSFRKMDWEGACSLSSEYDWVVVGSDQVWNSTWLDKKHIDWYYLKFAKPEQRIALAPSLGLSSIDANQAAIIRKGVEGFERLSVRERRGAELIKEATGREAAIIVDPTLAVPPSEWIDAAYDRLVPSTPYMLAYMLGEAGDEYNAAIGTIESAIGQIPIVPLSDKTRIGEPPAGPADFIGLIKEASHVITDSFHASVFSMLMNTPLTIVHRADHNPGMFSRLESLADTYGLHKNIFGDSAFDVHSAGNYEASKAAIAAERERFLNYFRSCLYG